MARISVEIFIFTIFLAKCQGGNRCAIAIGHLNCSSDQQWNKDTSVELMDDDGIGNSDDRMGRTTSDENGFFRVEGCGYDFGSDPDPYLRIWTNCDAPEGKIVKTPVNYTFTPDVIDYGNIDLGGKERASPGIAQWLKNIVQIHKKIMP